MAWNSVVPNGAQSVKTNRALIGDNTTYTEVTMGNVGSGISNPNPPDQDHFWAIDPNFDGKHRFMQMPAFNVGGTLADPVLGTSIDGCMYIRNVNTDVNRVEGYYKNVQGIYQFIPSFLKGTKNVNATYSDLVAVPKNVYGEIFMTSASAGTANEQRYRTVTGFFKSTATIVNSWAIAYIVQGTSTVAVSGLKFGNGSAVSGLNIRVRSTLASEALVWNYRITYRAF